MSFTPLYQSKVSDARGGKGLILAIDGMLEEIWNAISGGVLTWGSAVSKTIASGTVAYSSGYSHYQVDTEGAAATDDLTSFTGVPVGNRVLIRSTDAARAVTLVNGAGLKLQSDFTLNSPYDTIVLIGLAGDVCIEETRSSNG
jgi:hypothetical protein